MSIEHFKNTAHTTLTDHTPVAVPLSEPVAITSTHDVEHADGVAAGIWECTLGAGVGRLPSRSSATLSPAAAPSPWMAASR